MHLWTGARWRVGLSALTIAEYFRDQLGRDVLLLLDNVFRFVQAGRARKPPKAPSTSEVAQSRAWPVPHGLDRPGACWRA